MKALLKGKGAHNIGNDNITPVIYKLNFKDWYSPGETEDLEMIVNHVKQYCTGMRRN